MTVDVPVKYFYLLFLEEVVFQANPRIQKTTRTLSHLEDHKALSGGEAVPGLWGGGWGRG